MSGCEVIWREGLLFEISPLGTGFVEEKSTGRAFGFHASMIGGACPLPAGDLEGEAVRFTLTEEGKIAEIELLHRRGSARPPGREFPPRISAGRKNSRGTS
jgi:hypothetical protein